ERHYKHVVPVFGNGLITMPLQQWRKHRKVIGLTFNQQILNSFVDIFANYSNNLVEKLEGNLGKGCVDMFPVMSQCTLDTVCATTLGTEVNAMKQGSQYILWTSRASELGILRLVNIYLHPNFIWRLTSMSKEVDLISEKINHYVEMAKRLSKYQLENSSESTTDNEISKKKIFLDHLIDLIDKDSEWSNKELIDETRTLIVAGSDATALSVCYVLMMLGMHQKIQNLVLEEVDSIGSNSRDITIQDLPKMTYLENVIKETLRLFPAAPLIGRHLDRNVTLKNHILPAGTGVAIPILFLHRDPDLWNDPLTFDPDRFLPEEVAKRHRYSYVPFSGGPRNCIGERKLDKLGFRYAMMAMKIILSTILRHYRVVSTEYKSVSEIKLKFDVATKCVGGQKVELEKRFYC
ncbi:cytochrome P450 4C1-like, partial [Asbolus verrucosus]